MKRQFVLITVIIIVVALTAATLLIGTIFHSSNERIETLVHILSGFLAAIILIGAIFSIYISYRIQGIHKEESKAFAELKLSEEKYRTLVNNLNIGVYRNTPGPKGKFLEANPAIKKMFDYETTEDFMKHSVAEFYQNPEERKLVVDEISKKGSVKNMELYLRKKNGEPIWASLTATAHFNSQGEVDWIDGVVEDITEKKEAEKFREALNKINLSISSTLDINKILNFALKDATDTIGADSGGIAMQEGNCWIRRYVYKLPKETLGMKLTRKQVPHIMLAAKTKKPVVIQDTQDDTRVNHQLMKQFGFRSVLVIPLIVKEKVIGTVQFHYNTTPVGFDKIEVDFATKLGALISLAIENAHLYAEEKNISNILQEALLTVPEKIEGIEFGYLYRSATETAKVGGDFYDFFELNKPYVGVIVGDVSGKGIRAATLTSLVKDTVRAYAYHESSPAGIVNKTNEVVKKTTPPSLFVTLFFGILNKDTGELIYCSAGHPMAMIRKKTGDVRMLLTRSPTIGVFTKQNYLDEKDKLKPGDILILYTDGVTEAKIGSELFGEERLKESIKKSEPTKIEVYPQMIFDQIIQFTQGKLSDDLVLLSVELKEIKQERRNIAA